MAHHSKPVSETGKSGKPTGWSRPVMSPDERTVRQGLEAYEKKRNSLVQELKASVWSGQYDPDIDEVAEAMLTEREAEFRIAKTEEAAESAIRDKKD